MLQILSCRMDLAAQYGTDAAIFMNNIVYWVLKNQAEGKHFYDGRFWTYGTVAGFAVLYPLWSVPQIKRIIAKCREAGILLVGDFNKDRRDRTSWYSPSDEILSLYDAGVGDFCKVRNRKMQSTKSENALSESGKCIYKEQVATRVEEPPIVPQGTESEMLFDRFWDAYPRHQHEDRARKAWAKLDPSPALCQKMLDALAVQKRSVQWTEDGGKYIPHPATWLNGRCWKDDPGPMTASPKPPEIPPDDERRGRYL